MLSENYFPAIKFQAAMIFLAQLVFGCAPKADPPNVILILTDDQGYGDIGVNGNPYVKTPAMDKLNAQAVNLVNFHVDPCCSPTRSALLTGQYSSRTGVWHTIGGRSLLGTDNVTMAEVMEEAGYATAIFGKWHLGENYPFRPADRGFRESVIHGGGAVGANPDYQGNDYFDDTYLHNGKPEKYSGYCNTVWFTEAMKFIRKNKDNPFFCYVSTNVPHAPLNVDSSYSTPYRPMVSERLANYYGMITRLDEDLGVFLKELDDLELSENTIVIFMTDNGPCPWFGGIIIDEQGFPTEGYSCGMRGGKIWGYENAHRVPCFIRWPAGGVTGGREIGRLTAHIDLLPTLIDWCGLDTPENGDFDGISLDPLIRHPEKPWPDRTLFVHNQREELTEKYKEYQVLTEEWRLVKRDSVELYDILEDPGQTTDVSLLNPGVVQDLKTRYEGWWDHISVNFDQFNSIVLGNDRQNPSMLYGHDAHRPTSGPRFWVVDFSKSGDYEFVMYLRAEESASVLKGFEGASAVLRVGDQTIQQVIRQEKDGIRFTFRAPEGQSKIMVWVEQNDKTIHAYSLLAELK
jgi:arylsulfatase A-like enzyme